MLYFKFIKTKLTMTIAKPHYGKYLLVLSGSAESAPFLADWKVLKDDIRKNVRNPGWTDGYDEHGVIYGEKTRLKLHTDAGSWGLFNEKGVDRRIFTTAL
ncbi:nucleic acid binding [Pyrenophora seminiperda CCB06]|uniref:Nucleic acid binding n=1 Tax=Pyrenophora seminiperda CCB06 TaxID=1302712 RepID=A0A3M7MHX6_9PLEO|nr:nucleic acid binding [Pyrenophora seminiperda CCB06]